MPTYSIGACGCCGTICDPVSFRFVELEFEYSYSQSGSTWYTTISLIACVVEITHSNNVVETIDFTLAPQGATFYYVNEYVRASKSYECQGTLTMCGKTAQWRVVFFAPTANPQTYTLADATSVEENAFR